MVVVGNEQGQPRCFKCRNYGHTKKDCPQARTLVECNPKPRIITSGRIDGVESNDLLMDTGADMTTGHRRVVPRDRLIPQWVKVHTSTGECDVLQMARLEIEIKGRKEILDVAVSENTPHDALIGLDFPRCGRLSGDLEDELYPVVTTAVQLVQPFNSNIGGQQITH